MNTLMRTAAFAIFGIGIALAAHSEGAPAGKHSGSHTPAAQTSQADAEGDSHAAHGSQAHEGHGIQMPSDAAPETAAPAIGDAPVPGEARAPSGHPMSVTSSIADRGSVSGEVTDLVLKFDHPIRLVGATLSTLAGDRMSVRFDENAETSLVTVTFDPLQPDNYAFTWRADAGDHEMSGTVRFTVEE